MEKTTGNGGDVKMFVVKLDYPQQVMTEKWLLVLLIVGCTSLIFLICFPIDFYLYRRRKRLARERKNLTMYRPQTPTRAAKIHSKLTAKVATEINVEHLYEDDKTKYWSVRRFSNILSIFKNKSPTEETEMLEIGESLDDEMPGKTGFLQTIPESHKDEQHSFNSTTSSEKSTSQNVNRGDKNSSDRRAASRKFSYDLMDLRGRKKVFKTQHKHLRFGAHEPFENMTDIVDETDEKLCFTIPVKSCNLTLTEPENHNSSNSADIEFHDSHERQTDIILESDVFGDNVEENVFETDHTNRWNNSDKVPGGVQGNSKLIETGDIKAVKPCKVLRHSQSDQCIIEKSKKPKFCKGGKKRNTVTPTETHTFTFPEPKHKEDSPTSTEISLHLPPLMEHSLITTFKKKKRKRNKSSCSSMPELPYEKERY